jgi:hypothetical protein
MAADVACGQSFVKKSNDIGLKIDALLTSEGSIENFKKPMSTPNIVTSQKEVKKITELKRQKTL